jgi:integrase
MGTLQPFIESRKSQEIKKKDCTQPRIIKKRTINYALQVVRHILNLAASEWMDEYGMTRLAHAPKIKLLREDDKKEPYPLSSDEQVKFFAELPEYLAKMALFKVNTGCRDQEICGLRWEWEVPIPELKTSVFIIPAHKVKNRQERLVVVNRVAAGIIEERRGSHPEFVFTNSKAGQ